MTAASNLASTRRSWVTVIPIVGILVLAAMLATRTGDPLYNIESTDPTGMKGLRDILRDVGADVAQPSFDAIGDGPRPDVVVIADASRLGDGQLKELEDRERAGTRIVLLGIPSSLSGVSETVEAPTTPEACDVERLASLQPGWPEPSPYDGTIPPLVAVDDAETWKSCWGAADASLVAERAGAGGMVVSSDTSMFVNVGLAPTEVEGKLVGDWTDNGPIAVRLISGPDDICSVECRVVIVKDGLTAPPSIDGGEGLFDSLPTGGILVVAQLSVAVAVYAMARARRLGRVLIEPIPTEIEASRLVAATAALYQRAGKHGRASVRLRNAACDALGTSLGVDRRAGLVELIPAVASRSRLDEQRVREILAGPPVDSDSQLAQLDAALQRLLQEVRP